jgi:multidrug efflux pump subunit AcrA (membrane-fusion protein)
MSEQDLLKELHIDREAREGSGRGWPWRLLVALVVGGLAVAAYFALSGQAVKVDIAVAEAPGAGTTAVLDATGYVIARRQATVSSKISGKLAEVLIEEGVRVDAGQVLARLDDADAKAQLDLAQARLSAARSQLDQIRIQREQTRRDLKRQEELDARKLTSEESLDNARTQVESLSAQLEAQQSQVRVAEAERQVAQVAYDNTIVRAPFTGVVHEGTGGGGSRGARSAAGSEGWCARGRTGRRLDNDRAGTKPRRSSKPTPGRHPRREQGL